MVLVPVIAVCLLGAALGLPVLDHDLHAAVTISGHSTGRADFRNRAAVLSLLAKATVARDEQLWIDGIVSAAERSGLDAAAGPADSVTATVDSLVRERTVREEAVAAGIAVPTVDPWAELAAAAAEPTELHIRWIAIGGPSSTGPVTSIPAGWPAAPTDGPLAADTLVARTTAAAQAAVLLKTTPTADVLAAAQAAGWTVIGSDAWIGPRGTVDPIPDTLVAAIRAPGLPDDASVVPFVDEGSALAVTGVLLGYGPAPDVSAVRASAAAAGVDEAWIRPWAEARVLERSLEAAKVTAWMTTPSRFATIRELVVSDAGVAGGPGPYVGLAHLVIDRLPPSDLPSLGIPYPDPSQGGASALAQSLRSLPLAERLARWTGLVDAANATGATDVISHSGEIGWHDKADLAPLVGDLAFAASVAPGDILGPVTTAAGAELFLVRGTYPGTLDERAGALLTELDTAADPAAVARRVAPGVAFARYDPGMVRSELEAFGNAPATGALFDDPVGSVGRPFILYGQILVAVPESRGNAVPSGQLADRIRVSSFAAWLTDRMATHTVLVDPNPFGLPAPSATPAGSFAAAPTVEPMPTPAYPSIGPAETAAPAGASNQP
jgi:hypothetical protein